MPANAINKYYHPVSWFLLLTGFFFLPHRALAATFDFTDKCRNAYNEALCLRIQKARSTIISERNDHSANLTCAYLDNYCYFLELLTSEDATQFQMMLPKEDEFLDAIEKGPDSSPYKSFFKAEILIQWSVLRIKFSDYVSAVFELRKAKKLLEENSRRFPDFKANTKSLATLQCLFGSIPDNYKWGGNLLGLDGNMQEGLNQLNALIQYSDKNDFIFREETIFIYALLKFHLENKSGDAWDMLAEKSYPKEGNLLSYYICGHLAVYGGKSNQALQLLLKAPKGNEYVGFPQITYLTALAKLYQLDADASNSLLKFLKENRSQNYQKAVHQKLGWLALISGDVNAYHQEMQKVLSSGVAVIDADKQAQKEAESGFTPNVLLLKARINCDGGAFEKALELLKNKTNDDFKDARDKLEFNYRMGRIYHLMNQQNKALIYYQNVIETGRDLPYYFAANAALNIAYIYEERKNKAMAEQYFHICLSMKNHEYAHSLAQKAKAGLNRINND